MPEARGREYGVAMIIPLLLTSLLTAPRPLNVVVFMVDDLGWQDTSVPLHEVTTPFNARYWTPNLERLAAAGTTFTNAYAAGPVCTPTRTSLLTGQAPARTQITYWTLHRDQDTSKKHPRLRPPSWNLNGLQEGMNTLPKRLQDRGYRTIHVGKAHFGAHDTLGADPLNLGFEINIAGHASGAPASFLGKHDFSRRGRTGRDEPSVWDVPGLEQYHGEEIYLTEALTREAVSEIERSVEEGRPFYLNFSPYAVHTPIMANEKHLDRYATMDSREAAYATMIESYDEALGHILDRIEAMGLQDDTMIVFTSDNGGLSAHARGGPPHVHNAPLRSGKGSAYEGGTRVPTVIAWKGHVPEGGRSDVPIITQDLFPTILEATGTRPSSDSLLDGIDLNPVFSGQSIPERTIGWHQPHQWGASGPGIEPFTSIRRGSWKLIYFHDGPRFELYDLKQDPGETHDLVNEQPRQLEIMAGHMTDWMNLTGAQRSVVIESGLPIAMPDVALKSLATPSN